jgi:steroid delta-isomerase
MPTQAEMKAALQAYVELFNAGNLDGLAELYAEDAVVEDPVGTPPQRGRAAVKEFYRAAMATGSRLQVVAPARGSHGNAAVLVFQVVLPNGARINVADVMTFNDDGKIASMRAHWGPEDVEGSLG